MSSDKNHENWTHIPLLKELSSGKIQQLLSDGSFKRMTYGRGALIHLEGDSCNTIEVVLEGTVAVDRIDENGNLLAIRQFTTPGILGGNLLFSRDPRYPMTLAAISSCVLLQMDRETVFDLCGQSRAFLWHFLEEVSDNALLLGNAIRYRMRRTIRESLLAFLEHEATRQGSRRYLMPMTKKALSEYLGVNRSALSRTFTQLQNEGLFTFNGRHIILPDDHDR